ncbi:hypothetical protein J5N97_029698 [Dioscorea zingiberensis]|uniref:Palmitoyl-protein thioesterase n=1 Tax=Dioscorea zingiberensis TaxID=325984 RepID=A0A9D5BWG1_9LILI|nr:hypothetical protein J5N97_029698 [Dioscorea zingiberensis]
MARALVSVIVIAVVFAVISPISFSIPFIFVHGIYEECKSNNTIGFIELLSYWSGSPGHCIPIGNGMVDSWFMPLQRQTDILCEKVKEMEELKEGFNIVGTSQGTLTARGLVQFCDGIPPEFHLSIWSSILGIRHVPLCGNLGPFLCGIVAELLKHRVYTDFVQNLLAPSGYFKIPTAIPQYLEYASFLPRLNNERPNERNSTYKERFSSLNTLVLIMADNETVLVPKETSWFGYYPEGNWFPILSPHQTPLYKEDWIGLKTLDDEGRVKFISVASDHFGVPEEDIKKYIVPYLVDDQPPTLKLITKKGGASTSSGRLFSR